MSETQAMIRVSCGTLPGRGINGYDVPEGSTVKDVLEKAGLADAHQSFEMKMDGRNVDLGDIVHNNASVILTKKIKGNS